MKRTNLLLIVAIFFGTFSLADRGTYKLNKSIEKGNPEKVKEALRLTGPLDAAQKRKFLELVEEKIEQHEKIKMNTWDKIQLVVGGLLSTLLVEGFNDILPVLVENNLSPAELKAAYDKFYWKLGGGLLGIALAVNGWLCRDAHARYESYKKVQEVLEAAPQKSFNTSARLQQVKNQ